MRMKPMRRRRYKPHGQKQRQLGNRAGSWRNAWQAVVSPGVEQNEDERDYAKYTWFTDKWSLFAKEVDSFGPELITNGTFDTDTTGWNATDANLSVVSNRLNVDATDVNGYATQVVALEANVLYRLSVDYFDVDADYIDILLYYPGYGSTLFSYTEDPATDGSFLDYAAPTSSGDFILVLKARAASGKTAQFDNVSIKQVAGPNVCLQSRTFDTTWVAASVTPTQDQIGLDGVANSAWTLDGTNASSTSSLTQEVAIPNDGNIHTASLYIKKDSDTSRFPEVAVYLLDGTGRTNAQMLNTSTGALTSRLADPGTTASVVAEGDWWRVILTVTNNTSGNETLRMQIKPAQGDVAGVYNAATTGSIIADQAQVELNQDFASRPITTGAALVTNGDFANWTGDDPDDWTVTEVGDATSNVTEVAGACRFVSDGTMVNIIQSGILTAGQVYKLTVTVDAVVSGILLVQNLNLNTTYATLSTPGTHTVYFTAVDTAIGIKRGGVCDVTIDNVTVHEIPRESNVTTFDFKPVPKGNRLRVRFVGHYTGDHSSPHPPRLEIYDYTATEWVELIGPDLVTNGTFDTDSDWAKGTGWTIAAGVADCDGTQVSDTVLDQVCTSGVTTDMYKVTYTATRSAGRIRIYLGANGWAHSYAYQAWQSAGGTFTVYLRPAEDGTNTDKVLLVADSDFVGTIDNVVVKKVPQKFGPELVTNGDFSTGNGGSGDFSGWQQRASYGYETFNADGTDLNCANSSGWGIMGTTAITLEIGSLYKCTFDYTKNSGGDVAWGLRESALTGAPTQPIALTSTGSKIIYFEPEFASNCISFTTSDGVAVNFDLDNFTLKKVTSLCELNTGASVDEIIELEAAGDGDWWEASTDNVRIRVAHPAGFGDPLHELHVKELSLMQLPVSTTTSTTTSTTSTTTTV